MNLQDQVCTLEQAKRLKELGVKQDGRDQWIDFVKDFTGSGPYLSTSERYKTGGNVITYSAFSVAELGEIIGKGTKGAELHWQWLLDCVNQGLSGTVAYNAVALSGHVITQIENGTIKLKP